MKYMSFAALHYKIIKESLISDLQQIPTRSHIHENIKDLWIFEKNNYFNTYVETSKNEFQYNNKEIFIWVRKNIYKDNLYIYINDKMTSIFDIEVDNKTISAPTTLSRSMSKTKTSDRSYSNSGSSSCSSKSYIKEYELFENIKKTGIVNDILPHGFIYLIYPRNYNKDDIKTRIFYIGKTDDFNRRKNGHYHDLYDTSNKTKKYVLMRDIMKQSKIYDPYTYLEDDKKQPDDKKFWQIKVIHHLVQSCTQYTLGLLEGIYTYFYYSILNDCKISYFDYKNITLYQLGYLNEIGLTNKLMTLYNYDISKTYHSINPYEFIFSSKYNIDFNEVCQYHYELICKNDYIPHFDYFDNEPILTSNTIEYTENFLLKLKNNCIVNINDALPFIDERNEEEVVEVEEIVKVEEVVEIVKEYFYRKINTKFECPICKKPLSSKQSLYNHMTNSNIHGLIFDKDLLKEQP